MTKRKSLKTINLLENTPMWTGWNTERFTEKCPRQCAEYMQHISFLPTRTNVVKQTIIQSKRVSEECGSNFDLAIAKIAKEIQNEEPDEFKDLFIMSGAFHIERNIFSAISKIIEGSRGSYLVAESGVTAPESMNRFLKGKTYNRCRRSYIILSIALHESHFESFLMDTHTDIDFTDKLKVWLGTKPDQLPLSRMELSNQYQKQNINSVVQKINSTANDLNSDLIKISDWAFQWKMRFNPDPKKTSSGGDF